MIVCEENDGERRYWPLGERDRDVGVSVWPKRVYTSSFLRKSMTLTERQHEPTNVNSWTHVDFVVQCSRVYTRAIRTPADRRDGTSQLVHAHGLLQAFIPTFPYTNCSVITAGDDELDTCASCECSVQGINDTTVSVEFTHTLASREVRDTESVVCGDGVHELGGERPLKVEDGGFVDVGNETIVCVGRISTP